MKPIQGKIIRYEIAFEYEGKRIKISAKADYRDLTFKEVDGDKKLLASRFLLDHGACDCSRSEFLRSKMRTGFPVLDCGSQIKLLSLEFMDEGVKGLEFTSTWIDEL